MKKKYSRLLLFMILALIFAFIYEEIPRTILRNAGSQHLWELGRGWLPFFLIWYGVLFLIYYFIFINKNIQYPVIFGILYGLIFETFYFKMMENIFSFILFVLLYGGMFYFPFKIVKAVYDKEKIKRPELLLITSSQLIAVSLLLLISWAG